MGGWLYDQAGHATPFCLITGVLIFGAVLVTLLVHELSVSRAEQAASTVKPQV